jgi:hypothetical protein
VVRFLSVATDGTVVRECVLEPNITAAQDRMTTAGARWVSAFGEPHLLVGILVPGRGDDRLAGLRLYTEAGEIVATVPPEIEVDANRIPSIIQADLSGDGSDELLIFSTAADAEIPVRVYRFARRDGAQDAGASTSPDPTPRRVLAFNLCAVRMNGPDVAQLQRALVGRGFDVGRYGVDGWYGPDTRAAVIRFQRDTGLPVTGVVDDRLWDLLGL